MARPLHVLKLVTTNAPIALYDSGLGGLTVFRALREAMPHESFLYVGDTARVPYGPRSAAEIIRFNLEIVSWLRTQGAKYIVVACNTSSAIALPTLHRRVPLPVTGLIEAGAREAATVAANGHIGVIATEGTIRSAAYQNALAQFAPDAHITAAACPTLVPLVESGQWSQADAIHVVAEAIAPYLKNEPDALVLGCTHYPHLRGIIERLLPGTALIDPAIPLARRVTADIERLGAAARLDASSFQHFVVSGCPENFFAQAERLLPQHVKSVSQFNFEHVQENSATDPRLSADLYAPGPLS